MQESPLLPGRKKFLIWGSIALSSITFLKFISRGREKKTETVRMLTQDGTLVEIDKKLISGSGNKISNKDLQNWIKK